MEDTPFDAPQVTPEPTPEKREGAETEQIDTAWKACAYGDFEKLRDFVKTDPECVNRPDDQFLAAGVLPIAMGCS